ncbi:hypothetical protein [Sedimenticola thiotaurini]|uniref:Protein BatD n=1 Tax=Sedimenticola thiotaurini TaxID=1543721 RepID=A0A0F7JYF8_9GAMM|nr:hypothetical protein [Sedimenticola thiotaurini]AKH20757.1 hypothetical protein AAY24_10800 [Sedimenticola thiotaurini]
MIWFNNRLIVLLFGLLLLVGNGVVPAAGQAEHGVAGGGKKPAAPAMHHRAPKRLSLSNGEGAEITLWKPDLSKRALEPKMGVITLPPTGVDNYHAIVVEKNWGNSVDAIVRYEYLFGKPSGESPVKLLAAQKTPLEIVPDPLPREHHRYYARAEVAFVVRYKDQLLADQQVELRTGNGSSLRGVSDDQGRVVFRIPDDFPNIVPGDRDRRTADLSFHTTYETAGIRYDTTLSAEYRVSPEHWQSKPWGIAVAGVGFLFGGLITRRAARGKKGVWK